MDVFRQRLEDEYSAQVIITAPTVPYKIVYRDREEIVSNPTDFPDSTDVATHVKEIQEPVVKASIIVPDVTDFFDKLKSRSCGFASFDYEDAGYIKSNMAKMTFLLNAKPVDALALIVHQSEQDAVARRWVKKLHSTVPRQLFEVPIQAAIGKKIIARETLKALRRDVTAGLYGGHYERKLKHLVNQKESKKRMRRLGKVELSQSAFLKILSKE